MNNVAVLIPSCDKYRDLWIPFFSLFWKYWPDCKFKVYLGSNYAKFDYSKVKTINVGEDISWSDGLLSMISLIKEEYIIILLEDFFFREKINTEKIENCINLLIKLKGGMLRLVPNPGPDIDIEGSLIGIISREAPYRVSTQGAVWKKSVLLDLLKKGESAWEFELNGSKRSRSLGQKFYGATIPVLTYKNHVIERGKWFPKEAKRFAMMDIGCDFSKRKIMTPLQYFVWNLDHLLSKFIYKIPKKIKKTVKATAYRIVN